MNKNRLVVLSILIAGIAFALLPFKTSGRNEKFIRSANPVANRYIVVFNDSKTGDATIDQSRAPQSKNLLPADTTSAKAVALSTAYGGKMHETYEKAVKGFSVEMSESDAQALSQDPEVKYVEEDGIITASIEEQTNATWGLDRSDQRLLPLNGNYDFDRTGAGVNVYVIDTGIRTSHLEFGGRADMVYNAFRDGNNTDCNGHGTHVAGTIGGSTFGVAKNARLHGVRVLDCNGNGTTSSVIGGVDWVTRHGDSPAVANMSLEGSASQALDDAITSSIASGVTYVVAAGNANWDSCTFSPSRIPGAITVAASDDLDQSAWFTNWGTCVDLYAPGVNITSAWNTSDNTINTISGTSMASPHVAGAAALYLEGNQNAAPAVVSAAITSNGTLNVLRNVFFGTPNTLLYTEFAAASGCGGDLRTGTTKSPGQVTYEFSAEGFAGNGGVYSGVVSSPAGTQFTLALERKKAMKWTQVAGSSKSGSTVTYNGNSGIYRWRVTGMVGSGTYELCSVTP